MIKNNKQCFDDMRPVLSSKAKRANELSLKYLGNREAFITYILMNGDKKQFDVMVVIGVLGELIDNADMDKGSLSLLLRERLATHSEFPPREDGLMRVSL